MRNILNFCILVYLKLLIGISIIHTFFIVSINRNPLIIFDTIKIFLVLGIQETILFFIKNIVIFVVAEIQKKIGTYTKSHLFAIKLSEKVNC
jgi:hypothetical protein